MRPFLAAVLLSAVALTAKAAEPPQAPPTRDIGSCRCDARPAGCDCTRGGDCYDTHCPGGHPRQAPPCESFAWVVTDSAPAVSAHVGGNPTAAPAAVVATVRPTPRAPVGHTHTCPRCGTTWDHISNPGHNCPNCGTPQYVQDAVPRPVMTESPIATYVPTVTYGNPVVSYGVNSTPFMMSGGCANGSCGTTSRRIR